MTQLFRAELVRPTDIPTRVWVRYEALMSLSYHRLKFDLVGDIVQQVLRREYMSS